MRILYLAEFQDDTLVAKRGIKRNRNLGGSTKIERIAKALCLAGHEVEILSTGLAAERSGRLYGGIQSALPSTTVPVRFCPTIDLPVLNRVAGIVSSIGWVLRQQRWDVVVFYNFAFTETVIAHFIAKHAGCPLIAEYEDDATMTWNGANAMQAWRGKGRLSRLAPYIRGAIVVCPELIAQLETSNVLVLPGIVEGVRTKTPRPLRERPVVVYSGGLTDLKGPDVLLAALDYLPDPVDVHIFGSGPLHSSLERTATSQSKHRVIMHGVATRIELEDALLDANVCVNPHRLSRGHDGTLFPFKLTEYISFGIPVVSSSLMNVPEGIRNCLSLYDNDRPEGLAHALRETFANYDMWSDRAVAAQKYVMAEYEIGAVAGKLNTLLQDAVT